MRKSLFDKLMYYLGKQNDQFANRPFSKASGRLPVPDDEYAIPRVLREKMADKGGFIDDKLGTAIGLGAIGTLGAAGVAAKKKGNKQEVTQTTVNPSEGSISETTYSTEVKK